MASDDEAIPSPICDIESQPGQGTSKSFSASGGNADPFTGAGTYSSSSGVVSEQKCRGCSYNKSSLRGHLARTTKNCKSLYTEDDLIELERKAKSNKKEKIKQWKKDHSHKSKEKAEADGPTTEATASASSTHVQSQPSEPPVVNETTCRNCGFSKKSLRGHLARTTKGCSSWYTEEELLYLKNHADFCHRDKTNQILKLKRETSHVVCNICGKPYADKYVLDQHVAQIHNHETLKCPQCPKSFQRQSNLRDHLYTIHGDDEDILSKLTICKHCKKEFTFSQNLERHIVEQHLFNFQEFPRIKCTECEDMFTRMENMTSHREKAHDATSGFHKCGICEMIFSNTGNVNRHIKIVHGGEKIHACQQCSAHYSRKEHLENHIKKGKHYLEGICPHCEEWIVIKSESSWRDHFTKEPEWRKFETGWKEVASGKETCVNKLKKQREQMKEFLLSSTLCVHCNEVVPNKDAEKHWLLWDVEAPEKSTCRTNVSRRVGMMCWYCKGEIITKDYIEQLHCNWKFNGKKHPRHPDIPSSCEESIKRGLKHHHKKEKEIELKIEQRTEKRGILKRGDEGYEKMKCYEERYIERCNW